MFVDSKLITSNPFSFSSSVSSSQHHQQTWLEGAHRYGSKKDNATAYRWQERIAKPKKPSTLIQLEGFPFGVFGRGSPTTL
jgi:hypothetical protein